MEKNDIHRRIIQYSSTYNLDFLQSQLREILVSHNLRQSRVHLRFNHLVTFCTIFKLLYFSFREGYCRDSEIACSQAQTLIHEFTQGAYWH